MQKIVQLMQDKHVVSQEGKFKDFLLHKTKQI